MEVKQNQTFLWDILKSEIFHWLQNTEIFQLFKTRIYQFH